ncbi:MAG: hypothetical protein Q8L27_03205 [archaeon]|nr:hypothetical protein [archaeon]
MKKQILIGFFMFILNNNNPVMAQIEDAGMYKSGIDQNKSFFCSETPKKVIISCEITPQKDWLPAKYTFSARNLSTEAEINYQWQVLTIEKQIWEDIPNENSTTLIIIMDKNKRNCKGNHYRIKTTCSSSKLSVTSNELPLL